MNEGTMKIFIICPVRNVSDEFKKQIEDYVEEMESRNHMIHYPPRDTDQKDETGIRICTDNKKAIEQADEIHIFYDGKSKGALFDLGMAFALKKPVRAIRIPDEQESGKSFIKIINELSKIPR